MARDQNTASMTRDAELRELFERYSRAALGADPTAVAAFYDASFLAAGPKGSAAFRNDDAFLAWLREVHAFNVRSGMGSMNVAAIDELPIGGGFTLATVEWEAVFERTGATPIPFRISYVLRQMPDGMKIAAYISHVDQEETMRANGLL